MAFLDDRGRLFGTLNVIDAAVGIFALVLIPLIYAAAILFRVPPPRLIAVEPATIAEGTSQVTIKGEHLRPGLRAAIDRTATTWLFSDPATAVVQFAAPLTTGRHDVVLFDAAREIARLPGALTVAPLEETVVLVGRFGGLDQATAATVAGALHDVAAAVAWGEVLQVDEVQPDRVARAAFAVPAVLRIRCAVTDGRCRRGAASLEELTSVPLAAGAAGLRYFTIDEVHATYSGTTDVTVLAVVPASLASILASADRGTPGTPRERLEPRVLSAAVSSGSNLQQLREVSVAVRVPVTVTPRGPMYRGQLLRVGEPFALEHRDPDWGLRGTLSSVGPVSPE